jgi:hypothetical protein
MLIEQFVDLQIMNTLPRLYSRLANDFWSYQPIQGRHVPPCFSLATFNLAAAYPRDTSSGHLRDSIQLKDIPVEMDPQFAHSIIDGPVLSVDKDVANPNAQGTEETLSRKNIRVTQSARTQKMPMAKANIGAKLSTNFLRAKPARSNKVG